MNNIFHQIWTVFVWQPQINLLALFYRHFVDIGWSIIAVAVVVNIPLWLLYAKSYINLQKTRMLQPQIKELQDKYKEDPMEMRNKIMDFYKKHDVSQAATFQMLFFQLFFVTGLFSIVNEISKSAPVDGLYKFIFQTDIAKFSKIAFGSIDIGANASGFLWILALNAFVSFFYGYYTFKLAPQIKMPEVKGRTKEEIDQAKAMENISIIVGIYLSPVLITVFNYNVPIGVTLYTLTASFLSLFRQFVVTNYYAKETERLFKEIVESDPSYNKNSSLSSSDIIDIVENTPVAESITKNSTEAKQSKKKKKSK